MFGGADVGVDLGSGKGAVAEDGLDVFDVYAFFQKDGGEGVPIIVTTRFDKIY